MPEYRCHLANKYEDIVNLQGRRHIMVAARLQLVIIINYENKNLKKLQKVIDSICEI